jgi:hypothetical protein
MALTRTGERLRQYLWIARRAQDSTASGDPVEGLRTILGDRPWVLFAGAGLSCDPPASAPTFSHLRNAAGVAVSQRLVDLGILSAADAGAIEKGLVEVDRRDDIRCSSIRCVPAPRTRITLRSPRWRGARSRR